jgi:DNA polymerase III epsilon subunit-like protein
MANQDHVFIDLAVTDPSPGSGEIIAIAAVRTDRKGKVLTAFSERVKPKERLGESDELPPEYHASDWDNAPDIHKVWDGLKKNVLDEKAFDSNYVVVAHYAEIDRRFLREALGHEAFPKKAWVDTLQLAWPLYYNDLLTDRSFACLCKHFDVENVAPDTATGDCTALVQVYWKIMARYKGALLAEESVRAIGGEPLAKLRNWIGL